jgi:hypothetical protein
MDKKSSVLVFIEEERAKGASDQEITHRLLDSGWHMDIIQNALKHREQIGSFLERHPAPETKKGLSRWLDYRSLLYNPLFYAGVFALLVLFVLFV